MNDNRAPADANCASCFWWHHREEIQRRDLARVGDCRRHAPTLSITKDGRQHASFPTTHEKVHCGDHVWQEDAA